MTKETIRILGLDPRIGICVVEYNTITNQFTVLYFRTLSTTKFNKEDRGNANTFGKSLIFLEVTKSVLEEVMITYSPDVVVSEDAFLNLKFVPAFRVLCNWVCIVSLYLYENHKKILNVLAPKKIKKIIANHDNASKEEMYEALMKLVEKKEVIFLDDNYKESLTEHSVDAICVAISWIKK